VIRARDGRHPGAAGILAALVITAAVAACGGLTATASGTGGSVQPVASVPTSPTSPASPGSSQAALASPVTGVLVHIDSTGLAAVSGFRLRLDDGREVTFRIGTLENGDQFPPGHLAEHMASSDPVRVYFRPDGSDLVVYRIEDAGPSSPSASPAAS
jgi:hypothetical protein